MLGTLLEKELKDIIYSTKFSVTFAAAAVLVLLSFYVGIRNYQGSMREYEAARLADANNISALTDWRQAQHKVFRKPQPLQVLVNGVTNDIGRTTEIRSQGELTAINSRFSVDPLFAVFRFLDLNFVIVIVFSLFAILFGYDAINGEKEAGTLKLVFSNSVSRAQFILSKLLGSLIALIVPLLVPLLIGCLMMLGFGVPLSGDEWTRLVVLLAGGLLCFAAFLTLSIMISGLVTRSSVSFLISLVVWIFAVLIVPKGSVLAAAMLVDVPNVDMVEAQKRKFSSQQFDDRRKKMENWINANAKPDFDWSSLFNTYQDSVGKSYEKEREEFYGRLNEDWRNRKEYQERWAFGFSRISPTALFQIAAMNLANTDVALKYRYLDNLDRYQDQYADFIKKKVGTLGGMRIVLRFSGQAGQDEEKPKQLNPTELPEFSEITRPLGETLASALPDMGLLGVLMAVCFAGAFAAFLKFDLR